MPASDLPPVYYLDEGTGMSTGISGGGNITTSTAKTNDFVSISQLENFEVMDLVQMAVVYSFIVAAALTAIFIFMGGMSFILSGGDDAKIKQAINTIRYSLIGLIIVILSFTFVMLVGKMFGLHFLDYLSYGTTRDLINRLISSGSSDPTSFDVR